MCLVRSHLRISDTSMGRHSRKNLSRVIRVIFVVNMELYHCMYEMCYMRVYLAVRKCWKEREKGGSMLGYKIK